MDGGTVNMSDTASINGNTANEGSDGGGGGVYVHGGSDGRFTMSGGSIKDNVANASYGGGVYVNNGTTFTMSGGTISGNVSKYAAAGVFVGASGNFNKSGTSIIYGYTTSDPNNVLWNVVSATGDKNSPKHNCGHAAYVNSSPQRYRDTTAGSGTALSYNYNNGSPIWGGSWTSY
jgi:hypothetical protein